MKEKSQIVISVIMLLFATANTPNQEVYISGVSSGDYFTYEMYGSYVSNMPEIVIDIPEFERNTTDWVRIEITSVEGSVVNQIYTLLYLDGRNENFSFKSNLNPEKQGVFRIANKGVPICSANLQPGERLPTAELRINETICRTYACGDRKINHAMWNVGDDYGDIYFDKETGMMVELLRSHIFVNKLTGMIVEKTDIIQLIDTNRWQIA